MNDAPHSAEPAVAPDSRRATRKRGRSAPDRGMSRRRAAAALANAWGHARESLWLIPAVCVVFAIACSIGLLEVDASVGAAGKQVFWLFDGNADGARTVLSVIAGSLVTVIAVAFSVTIVALQQAATQYTPRVLGKFTSDRGNQVVLGVYIATFCYALLILRRIRAEGSGRDAFIPSVSISMAMLLSLVSLFALIYFIHHLSESLQIGRLLGSVTSELDRELERLYPATLGRADSDPRSFEEYARESVAACVGHELTVCAIGAGHLRDLDLREIERAVEDVFEFVRIPVQIGDYVYVGDVLLRAFAKEPRDDHGDVLLSAFHIDRNRSPHQDPLFAIQQLVDIGLKALSPGINDATTAEQALDHLGSSLSLLAGRTIPSPERTAGGTKILAKAPAFADYIDAAFSQIQTAARGNFHVTRHLARVLEKLVAHAESDERRALLRCRLDEMLSSVDLTALSLGDRERLIREFGGLSGTVAEARGTQCCTNPAAGSDAGQGPHTHAARVAGWNRP